MCPDAYLGKMSTADCKNIFLIIFQIEIKHCCLQTNTHRCTYYVQSASVTMKEYFFLNNIDKMVWDPMQWVVSFQWIETPIYKLKNPIKKLCFKKNLLVKSRRRKKKKTVRKLVLPILKVATKLSFFVWECTENCLNQIGEDQDD